MSTLLDYTFMLSDLLDSSAYSIFYLAYCLMLLITYAIIFFCFHYSSYMLSHLLAFATYPIFYLIYWRPIFILYFILLIVFNNLFYMLSSFMAFMACPKPALYAYLYLAWVLLRI